MNINVETQTQVFENEKVNRKCELAIVLLTQRSESSSQDESIQTEIPELNTNTKDLQQRQFMMNALLTALDSKQVELFS